MNKQLLTEWVLYLERKSGCEISQEDLWGKKRVQSLYAAALRVRCIVVV